MDEIKSGNREKTVDQVNRYYPMHSITGKKEFYTMKEDT